MGFAALLSIVLCILVSNPISPNDPTQALLRSLFSLIDGTSPGKAFGLSILAIIASCTIVFSLFVLVGLIMGRRRRKKTDFMKLGMQILLIALLSWLLSLQNASTTLPEIQDEPLTTPIADGRATFPAEAKTLSRDQSVFPAALVLALGALMALAVAVFPGINRRLKENRQKPDASNAAETARSIRKRFESDNDVRTIIIACYDEMCTLFAQVSGLDAQSRFGKNMIADTLTAREFLALLDTRHIADPEIGAMTCVFEKARYSDEPCGEEDRAAVTSGLVALEKRYRVKQP